MIAELKAIDAAPSFATKPDWSVVRLWRIARIRSEKGRPDLPLLSVFLNRGVIPYGDGGGQVHKPGLDLSIYQVVCPGDLVLNNQQAWRGSVGVSKHNGIISPAYVVLALAEILNPRFADYLFQSRDMVAQYVTSSKGVGDIQRDIHTPWLKNVKVPLPDSFEQTVIVRFLDWASGRLGQAIRAKRKVIALLNEQKQAIIHRAVTRGLDPNVPLKPSGIRWLDDIPKHWEVRPLKAVCHIQSGITLGKDYVGQTTHEYPYLRVANVQAGHASLAVVKTIRVTRADALRCMLQRGDVLMTEGGDPDKLGRGCVWDSQVDPCLHQNHVFAVRPDQSKLEPRFLSALMGTRCARAYFQSTAKQTTNLASTNKTKIGQFQVLLPKVDEQQHILTAIYEETRPIDNTIGRLEREIDLLREYRTRLVADVVTGKFDVRGAASRLPQEATPDIADDIADLGDEAESIEEETEE